MMYKVHCNPSCSKNHQYCDEEIKKLIRWQVRTHHILAGEETVHNFITTNFINLLVIRHQCLLSLATIPKKTNKDFSKEALRKSRVWHEPLFTELIKRPYIIYCKICSRSTTFSTNMNSFCLKWTLATIIFLFWIHVLHYFYIFQRIL